MDDAGGGLDHSEGFEHSGYRGDAVLEQSQAPLEEHGQDVELKLVHYAGPELLLGDAGAAAHGDVPLAGGRPCLGERGLDAVGDEGECGPVPLGHWLAGMVGDDEHWVVEGRADSPPAVRVRIVLPAAIPAAEHAPADHGGSHVAVLLAVGRHVACPVLEPALAERSVEGPELKGCER